MYYNLDKLKINIVDIDEMFKSKCIFLYDGKKYFYKKSRNEKERYNELIAEMIAKDLGIPCAHYTLGEFNNQLGVVSECFDTSNCISMKTLLDNFYIRSKRVKKRESFIYDLNNFEDIRYAFENLFPEETVTRLMSDLVNIFFFDIIIGNNDRHPSNYGLMITEDNVEFAPLFDNEELLTREGVFSGQYSILTSRDDDFAENIFHKFINANSPVYLEKLETMVEVINTENLNKIFEELTQQGVEIPYKIKLELMLKFEINYSLIKEFINNKKQKTKMKTVGEQHVF